MLFFFLLLLFSFPDDPPKNVADPMEGSFRDNLGLAVQKTQASKEHGMVHMPSDPDTLSYTYDHAKLSIGELRKCLGEQFKEGQISMEGVKNEFTMNLVEGLIPHWYGTPWSFGGHTATPKQGKIACGYFISTTLRDMGLRLNRYKLAQKSPIDEAMAISCGSEIYSVDQEDHEEAYREIDNLTREGLYFIGFDTGHVGYLLKREGKLLLIHSNYLAPIAVCMEDLKDSRVFKSYTKFHLVDITHNKILLQRWLNDSHVL